MSSRLGAYEILKELKAGGMGEVLLARRRGPGSFEQLVAIKTIRAELARTPQVRAMFLDEAAILARLQHPAVAHVHDFGEDEGTLYMVMEYVAGVPFRDLVDLGAPPHVIAQAVAAAARGLHAAHEARDIAGVALGLVHRDISPDNLLLAYDGHVKVIDFGIALVKNRQTPVTEIGTLKGKPPYMSPEQVKNEPVDRRSDVFSLGVVAWELLTGKHLFQGDSLYAIAVAVDQQPIEPPSEVRGTTLSSGLDSAVLHALERDLDRRTPTAAAFADELQRAADGASGDSLEAWTLRALGAPREAHARWLAALVAGDRPGTAPQRGRATGQVTALAANVEPVAAEADTRPVRPVAASPELLAAAAEADTRPERPVPPSPELARVDGRAATQLASSVVRRAEMQEPDAAASLRVATGGRRNVVVILVLALLVAGAGVFLATRPARTAAVTRTDAAVVAVAADAALVDGAAPVVAVEETDAALAAPSDASLDAAVGLRDDAPRGHVVSTPPPPRTRDAGVVVPTVRDAAVAVATGTGQVVIKQKPGPYVNISIDGGSPLPGPIVKRSLAAGKHTIAFLDPRTGDVLDTQTVTVADGETAQVAQH